MHKDKLAGIRALILDMDGVLWRGATPIGNLPTTFAYIRSLGFKAVLATNNSTKTVEQYLDTLKGFGVELEPWQVINSSTATAQYLANQFPQRGPGFILGEEGLVQTMQAYDFYHAENGAQFVVSGMDREINFDKLKRATLLIRSGVPFIATNPDRTFPTPEGLIPGAGAIIAALVAATDVKPFVIGKPEPEMYRLALRRLDLSPQSVLVIGDRLETDIAGAQNLGCPSGLVLSGVTSPSQAKAWQPAPDIIANDLFQLLKVFE